MAAENIQIAMDLGEVVDIGLFGNGKPPIRRVLLKDLGKDYGQFIDNLYRHMRSHLKENNFNINNVVSIGIVSGGIYGPDGTNHFNPKLPFLEGKNLGEGLEAKIKQRHQTEVPVRVGNEANYAALAYWDETPLGEREFLFLSIRKNGLGSAWVDRDGKLPYLNGNKQTNLHLTDEPGLVLPLNVLDNIRLDGMDASLDSELFRILKSSDYHWEEGPIGPYRVPFIPEDTLSSRAILSGTGLSIIYNHIRPKSDEEKKNYDPRKYVPIVPPKHNPDALSFTNLLKQKDRYASQALSIFGAILGMAVEDIWSAAHRDGNISPRVPVFLEGNFTHILPYIQPSFDSYFGIWELERGINNSTLTPMLKPLPNEMSPSLTLRGAAFLAQEAYKERFMLYPTAATSRSS